jgi:hypothetical protein
MSYLLLRLVACMSRVTWYDASSTAISSSTGTAVSSSTSTWTRLSVTGTAPALAVTATCYVVITSHAGE